MDEHYIWLFNKSDNRGLLAGAFLSFLLHLLMFAVMATTSIFYPIAGDTTKIDVVWLYPSFLFGGETDSQPSAQSTPEPPPPSPVVKEVEAPAPPPASTEPPPAPKQVEQPSPPQTTKEEVAPPAAEPVNAEPDTEPEPEMTLPVEAAPVKSAKAEIKPEEPVAKKEAPHAQPVKKEEMPKYPPPVEKREPVKVEKPAPAPEPVKSPSPKVVSPPQVTPAPEAPKPPPPALKPPVVIPKPPAVASPRPPAEPPKTDAVKQTVVTPPQAPVSPTLPRKETVPLPTVTPKPSVPAAASDGRKIALEKRSEPSPAVVKPIVASKPAEKTAAQSAGPKGIFAPPLVGDLKIEVTGPEELLKVVKMSVIFREYPKTRHNRPMTKAVARNFQTLTPKMVRIAKNTLQAVIEVAEEGIYEFRDISEPANPGDAAFNIKIYENSGRAKTKVVGSRKVGARSSIVRIMMPEGILWDDESAFSGSMEDSESTTKFNSETGLAWKEYKE